MYSRTSWEATSGLVPLEAQHGRGRFIRPKRASSANMMRKLQPRLAANRRAFLTAVGKPFFKSVLSRKVALGMKRTRHQLAPAMPVQKIVDCAVAGRMPDRLFVSRLEIVDVEHLARSGSLGKARQQSLFRGKRHVLALAPANRFRLERLDPAPVIGHVGAVHGAQRNAHRLRNRRLRHSALAQQHHLDALALCCRNFPAQRCFQFPDLLLGALDHPSPRIRQPKRIISRALMRDRKTPKIPRFKQLWKRYYTV